MEKIFNRQNLLKHRTRFKEKAITHPIIKLIADNIKQRLLDMQRNFNVMADISAYNAMFRSLIENKKIDKLIEMAPGSELIVQNNYDIWQIIADDEMLPFKQIDLIISNLNLHYSNDLPGSLKQIYDALNNDGLFIGAIFGDECLLDLRKAIMQYEIDNNINPSPHIIPMVEIKQAAHLLSRVGFQMPISDKIEIEIEYPNIKSFLYDVKHMGESNILFKMKNYGLHKNSLVEIERCYRDLCNDKIIANFVIVIMTGFKIER